MLERQRVLNIMLVFFADSFLFDLNELFLNYRSFVATLYVKIKVCLWNTDYAPCGNKVQKAIFSF